MIFIMCSKRASEIDLERRGREERRGEEKRRGREERRRGEGHPKVNQRDGLSLLADEEKRNKGWRKRQREY